MQENLVNQMMYINALHGLENGCLMPWDKEILASNPLPSTVIEPYTTKEVPNVLESMNITFSAMSVWIEEAKKVNYFSKRFVQLSKMVMNGVTTMGRGLVTLHQRGEDLSQAPMSIQDLLGVASYHFRKSYLGVLQTSRSHPEIGERLLMNQIGWNNMLMRLFKTRDKLKQVSGTVNEDGRMMNEEKAVAGGHLPAGGGQDGINEDGRMKNEEKAVAGGHLPAGADLLVQNLTSPISEHKAPESGFSAPSAIREPAAFTAPRAFSSYENRKSEIKNGGVIRNKKSEIRNDEENVDLREAQDTKITTTENEEKSEGKQLIRENEEEQIIETENREKLQSRETDQDSEDGVIFKGNLSGTDNETEIDLPSEPSCRQSLEDVGSPVKEGALSDGLSTSGKNGDSPVKGQSPVNSPSVNQSPVNPRDSDLPPYLQILQNVFARSGPSENGEVTFTFDEICYLAFDPDFNRIYPDQAAQMRSILQNVDSS